MARAFLKVSVQRGWANAYEERDMGLDKGKKRGDAREEGRER